MKQHEEVKINDFEAQRQSILKNIAIANKQLESSHAKVQTAEKSLVSLQSQIRSAAKELDGLLVRRANTKKAMEDTHLALEKNHKSVIEKHEVHLESLKTHTSEVKKLHEKNVNELVSRVTQLTREVDELEERVVLLRVEDARLAPVVEKSKVYIGELRAEIYDLLSAADLLKEQHGREMLSRNNELNAILEKIEAEKAKIEQPMKTLDAREVAISRREYDFRVMYSRLKYHWEKLYPGQNLNI